MGDKVKPDSHYTGGEFMRKIDLAARGNVPDPVSLRQSLRYIIT
jgi:hypothetical protein